MSSNSLYMLAIFVIFIAFFYFVAIRPQSKQRKAHQAMMNTLAKGDVVMLASGIYGKVKRVEDNVVVVEVAKGVTMKVVRRAIADIIRDSDKAKALAPEGGSSAGSRGTRAAKSRSIEDYEAASEEEATGSDD